jgi:hypothetical protein
MEVELRDNNLKEIRFDQAIKDSKLMEEIRFPLRKDRATFFKLGMSEIANDIIPLIKTFDANVDGPMSDKDFRKFSKTIIDQIKEYL